jgi:hypothetical protein
MKIKITFLIAALILLPVVSNAQGGVLRRALNRAIEKEIDTAVNKKIEEDKARAKANEKNDEEQKEADDQKSGRRGSGIGIFGGATDIKHNDEYSFTGRIFMQMETYDKKDVAKSDYYTYFNANTSNAGIEFRVTDPEKGESVVPTMFIFDNENRCFMMLIPGEDSKTGIISTIPDDSTLTAKSKSKGVASETPATITKTGNTKMIAGYKCDEYKVVEEDDDGYAHVWMTKDVKIKADKRNWGKTGMPTYYNYPGFEGSMMLAMERYDKDNKLEMKMETKEINDNYKHSISTVGYSLIKMNFSQAGRK